MNDRVPLAHLPTPLEPMERLTERLGGPRLLVKRDDLTGLALGGNKARKLEFLCAEALAHGCDALVTGGGPQSNHARMTAAAAAYLGLECHLAVPLGLPDAPSGNLVLDELLGAYVHATEALDYDQVEVSIIELARQLGVAGRTPFAIPVGGASTTGVLSYARAVAELLEQTDPPDWIVVADGSGGTHAGLLAGLAATGASTRVVGVDVGTRPALGERVPEMARAAVQRLRTDGARFGEAIVDRDHFGEGYGIVTDGCREALRLVARAEGIVLDPVYSGKAMAGLFSRVRDGRIPANATVVFWHTGGAPALFATEYASERW